MPPRDKPTDGGASNAKQKTKAEAQAAEIRHLSKPFWATVLIGGLGLLVFVTFLTRSLDTNAVASSEQIYASVMADRVERLEDIALEYGYWDVAVDNLVDEVNLAWVKETFADYVQSELQIDAVHVLNGANAPTLHIVDDEIREASLAERYGDGVNGLISRARATKKDQAPKPASGFVGTLEELYLVSTVLLTSYNGQADLSTDHVLVLAQAVDKEQLSVLSERYHLPGLHLSNSPPSFQEAGSQILTSDNESLGYFVWSPNMLGLKLLPLFLVGLIVFVGFMYLAARIYLRRASELASELAQAKLQTKQAREQLMEQVRRDPLTGLGNRRFLDEKLAELQSFNSSDVGHALLYLDLDRFKNFNETHGYDMGDEVLKRVSAVLASVVQDEDTVLRVGGDEFVVVFGAVEKNRVLATGHAIIDLLGQPEFLSDVELRVGTSVGVAFSPNPSDLLRQANVALYSAKQQGRGQVAVYSAELLDTHNAPVQETPVADLSSFRKHKPGL